MSQVADAGMLRVKTCLQVWWYITLIAILIHYIILYIYMLYMYISCISLYIVLGCHAISMKVPASWDPCPWCQLQSWQLHLLHWPIEPCWGHACQGTPSVGNPLPGSQPATFHATNHPLVTLTISSISICPLQSGPTRSLDGHFVAEVTLVLPPTGIMPNPRPWL